MKPRRSGQLKVNGLLVDAQAMGVEEIGSQNNRRAETGAREGRQWADEK